MICPECGSRPWPCTSCGFPRCWCRAARLSAGAQHYTRSGERVVYYERRPTLTEAAGYREAAKGDHGWRQAYDADTNPGYTAELRVRTRSGASSALRASSKAGMGARTEA